MVNQIPIAPCLFSLFLFVVQAQAKLAPALYIFGDSFVDPGNNIFLKTHAQANYTPYGIDHPLGVTGRSTNGLTVVDYFAKWIGLNFQPPAKDPRVKLHPTYQGLNYGSASAGLLPESGSVAGENLCLKEQVELFTETVRQQLTPHFKTSAKLAHYLSRSVFYIHIGHNDYGFSYLSSNSTYKQQYNPAQFADFLLIEMERNLKAMYKLGARKIIVSEISPLGCTPGALSRLTTPPPTGCIDERNALVRIFNSKLAAKLRDLSSSLKGSTFVVAKEYSLILDMVENPSKYGIPDVRSPCITSKSTSMCKDRNSHIYWDEVHPTQVVLETLATQCFNGTNVCVPMNIQELAKKK